MSKNNRLRAKINRTAISNKAIRIIYHKDFLFFDRWYWIGYNRMYTYLENGAVKTEQYDKEFTPFELLGIVTHIKNEIELDLLQLSKPNK